VGLASVAAAVAAGMALRMLRTVRARLDTLAAGTHELGRGNMSFRLNFRGADELSSLAGNIDRMARQIEELHRELDARATRIEEAYAFQKEFFAMMTHELRAPLNSILGFCELIREDETALGQLAAGNLRWIEANARRMIERVNMILTLAKIEAGRLEITVRHVALRPVLEDIAQGLRAQIKTLGRDITVTLDVAANTPSELRTDEEKLRHILGNLASNASKFTEQGSIRIGVEGTDDGRLSVALSDTGVGITEDRLDIIFEHYHAGVWRGSGTGIGLALARRFARLIGGDITVRSRTGEGSTFTLVLGDAPDPSKEDSEWHAF
jgi:signal transduction histidine kinase